MSDGRAQQVADDPGGRGLLRRAAGRTATAAAGVLVFLALVAPNDLDRFTVGMFTRLPVEALLILGLALLSPARARRPVAVLVGVGLGVLTVLKILDMGFLAVLARQFDPVLDWILLDSAVEFLDGAFGRAGAIGAAVGAGLLVAVVLALVTLSVLRLTGVAVRRRAAATRVVAAGTVVWVTCAVLGAQLVPDTPVAAWAAGRTVHDRALQIGAGLQDQQAFAQEAAVDAFRDTPADELLTALRGKDVVFTFVESYGRVALDDPEFAPQIRGVLADGDRGLDAAGFGTRSAFLTSPVAGGGSWLAHATFLSGLRIDNQQRYRNLTSGDRLTLTSAFRRAGWETVAVMPGTTRAWPEGAFYGYQRAYDATTLGYRGPNFSWATMPDQYTLSAFERLEHGVGDRAPLMAEIPLVSSHAPWTPVPDVIGWDRVGDGSVFAPMAAGGDAPDAIWRTDPAKVRADYRSCIAYSLQSVISYVETYGDDDLVLVLLGDHQPAPVVTGPDAGKDVPISVVTRNRGVLDRIAGWGWQDGLAPGEQAPVWPMNDFRDRFLTAFGQASPAPPH